MGVKHPPPNGGFCPILEKKIWNFWLFQKICCESPYLKKCKNRNTGVYIVPFDHFPPLWDSFFPFFLAIHRREGEVQEGGQRPLPPWILYDQKTGVFKAVQSVLYVVHSFFLSPAAIHPPPPPYRKLHKIYIIHPCNDMSHPNFNISCAP